MASHEIITLQLALLHELFPTRDLSEHTAAAWEVALSDVSDESLEWAVARVMREPGRTFFPTPSEIRQHLPAQRPALSLADPNDPVRKWYAERAVTSKRVRGPSE